MTSTEEYTGASVLPNTGWTEVADTTAGIYQQVFKANLFTATGELAGNGGTPANNSPVSASPKDNTWSDVEIKQVAGVITMSVDHTPIFTNTAPLFSSGYLMLGYDCPIEGIYQQFIGTPDASAYFANLQVVALGAPTISQIITNGSGCVVITFAADPETSASDTASNFTLLSASTVNGTYTAISPQPTITSLGSGNFQATICPLPGSMQVLSG